MRLNSGKKISYDIIETKKKIDYIEIKKKKVKTKRKKKKGEKSYFNNRVIDTSDESDESE